VATSMKRPAVTRRPARSRMNASGVVKIQRDSYSTVNGFTVKNSWWELSAQVRKRSGGMCEDHLSRGLKVKGVDVHHVTPLSKGGRNVVSNLLHLCEGCHERRHNHMRRGR
jgi:5-methylcytosine-specific restriction endonuclease McrA